MINRARGCRALTITSGYRSPEENNINGLGKDYGHVLPVRLITGHGVNKFSEIVDARIRSTLKA
jgi:hypothetical protein